MKKSFIHILCLLATIAVFTSCGDQKQKQEQEAKKKLITGDWVTKPGHIEEILKYAMGEIDQELLDMFEGSSIAMQFNTDGSARIGIFIGFYADYGILKENEYLDMYSENESEGLPSITLSWSLSEDGNTLITHFHVPSYEQNGQTIPEVNQEDQYTIDLLTESELTLVYNNAEDPDLGGTLQFVRPTNTIRFVTVDDINSELYILPKHIPLKK